MVETARFEPLVPRLLGVLGRLAAQGLVHGAMDAFDLVNDFYAEAWPGVLRRYDPNLGPFERYALASFARYARTAAARDSALQRRFRRDVDVDTSVAPAIDPGALVDAEHIAAALRALPAEQRRVLMLAFDKGLSERSIARELGVSRYVAGRRLAEAVAALVVTLADRGLLSDLEQRLARALFVEGETLEAAAADAGLPLARARALRQRILNRFTLHPRDSHEDR